MRLAICAIAKCENQYINDWCRYHLALGFNHIYLFDNNDISTPNVKGFIDPSMWDSITIFNVNGVHKSLFQNECYTKFYQEYKAQFDWCAYIDIDEYIHFDGFTNIQEFLAQEIFESYEVIRLKWHLYGDDDVLVRDETIPVDQFFKKRVERTNKRNQCKTIIRGGLSNEVEFTSSHYPSINGKVLKSCMSDGTPTVAEINAFVAHTEVGWINHYMTKTLNEFLKQKYARTDAQFKARQLDLQYYWDLNSRTEQKEEFIDEFLKNHPIEKKTPIKGFDNYLKDK